MDKFIETYGERPDGHGGLPTMATRAQDTWDALRAAYEIGKSEARTAKFCDACACITLSCAACAALSRRSERSLCYADFLEKET